MQIEQLFIYIMARAYTSISWWEHIHLYHGESIYIYIMARAFTSISWREHLHLYHGEIILKWSCYLLCTRPTFLVGFSSHSDILSRFRANQSKTYLFPWKLSALTLNKKATIFVTDLSLKWSNDWTRWSHGNSLPLGHKVMLIYIYRW